MQRFILEKAFVYKLFMLTAFVMFTLVMYQGYLKDIKIYAILYYIGIALCAFQIASFFYVLFIKREVELSVDEESISWKTYDNKKQVKEEKVNLSDIEEVKTEVSFLTGAIYSSFTLTLVLKDKKEISLTDGLLYDFGLKQAEELCRYLLNHNLGHTQDIKFSKLIKSSNIDISEEQIFFKKDKESYYTGVISKNKKEFLSLRLQIDALYDDYKIVENNTSNEYFIRNNEKKESFIRLRSNAIGYFVEFYKVSRKEDLKSLKQMGKRNKIGF